MVPTEYPQMLPLPPVAPPIGLHQRVRLARDHYVRLETVDYSVDPHAIGRFVDVVASPWQVTVRCDGQLVGCHERSWAKVGTVTDPAHRAATAAMRLALALERQRRRPPPATTATVTPSPCGPYRTTTCCSASTSPMTRRK